MNSIPKLTTAFLALVLTGAAYAWTIKDINPERKDVFCDDGAFVGSMFWNGKNWSDGQRWDPDPAVVARQMVAAQGASCR